jgi:SAM-dependent methyltransferase
MYTQCPLCGSKQLIDRFQVKGYTITYCADCTLKFVREVVSDKTLTDYYEFTDDDYVYDDPANVANLNYYDMRLRNLIMQRIPGGKMLDVGCSGGRFLDAMGSEWERHGIELVPHYAEVARQKYGDNIHTGTIEDYTPPAEPFDVVTLIDMFDHCRDPLTVLRRANRLARKDGLIVVKVHNISCLWAKLAGPKFYAVIPPEHLFYYNKATLARIFQVTGFQVDSVNFVAHRLALKTIPYRLAQRNRKSIFYKLYNLLDKSSLGTIPIYKNFHDLITVIGHKVRDV